MCASEPWMLRSTECRERAVEAEGTIEAERAVIEEGTVPVERAASTKCTVDDERAVEGEGTE
jgi:hypothetical protein